MDCLEAQQVLSEAFDGELVDAAALAESRRHAASCSGCAAFHVMLSSQRALRPQAPDSLVTAIVGSIRAESAAAEEARAAAEEAAATPRAEVPEEAPGDPAPPALRLRPGRWRFGASLAAAAALVVGFGLLTNYGIALMGRSDAPEAPTGGLAARDSAAPQASAESGGGENNTALSKKSETTASPRLVALDGLVYTAAGSRGTVSGADSPIGTVHTALDGDAVRSISAFAASGSPRSILLTSEEGDWLAFSMVTRTLQNRIYVLTVSGDIDRYGDWPSLPQGYREPASSSGSPYFQESGKDDMGVTVYAPRGSTPEGGFAIAPGTAAADPAMGNPNWTWWAPLDERAR